MLSWFCLSGRCRGVCVCVCVCVCACVSICVCVYMRVCGVPLCDAAVCFQFQCI